jgi:hypothetical protein
MTTREKIIVGLMGVAILYGAWELLGNQRNAKPTSLATDNPVQQVRTFVSGLSQKIVADKIPAEYQYLISQASDRWVKDPFILTQGPLSVEKTKVTKKNQPEKPIARPTFVYSGFLKIGKSTLAIINGLEYAVGDALATNDYFVKSVSPRQVVIRQINGSETVALPIQDAFPE